jgi:hypothetical protein
MPAFLHETGTRQNKFLIEKINIAAMIASGLQRRSFYGAAHIHVWRRQALSTSHAKRL